MVPTDLEKSGKIIQIWLLDKSFFISMIAAQGTQVGMSHHTQEELLFLWSFLLAEAAVAIKYGWNDAFEGKHPGQVSATWLAGGFI